LNQKGEGNMDYIKAIEKEIEWCKSHPGESAKGVEFEKAFILGLTQAIYIINKVIRIRDQKEE